MKSLWQSCPALLYGIAVLLACSAAYSFTPFLLFPIALLACSLPLNKCLPATLAFAAAYFFASHIYHTPHLPPKGVLGHATLCPWQISLQQTKFKKSWIYRCSLTSFHTPETTYTFPGSFCLVKLPASENRPPANVAYTVHGTLKEISPGRYSLTVKNKTEWQPMKKLRNLAEWRYDAKLKLQNLITKNIPNEQCALFLAGIATGQFSDPYFSFEFGRFGLQHIMAISGFHFATIAFILSLLLRIAFPYKITALLIVIWLTLYFLLLGFSPSVLRAWLMILIGLSSQLLEKPVNSLNTFGFALLATLLIDPLMLVNLGFQLSFAITAGILLLFSPINRVCKALCTPHTPTKLSIVDQHGYLLLCFLRQGLALTLTVHLIGVPLVLLYFQKFPLLSAVYNLFFPFLVGISMLFLILSFLTMLLPPLSTFFYQLNNSFTEKLINLTYYLPQTLDYTIRSQGIRSEFILLYLSALYFFGLWLANRRKENQFFIFV